MVLCSVVSDSVIPWAVAHQAPLSMEFSRQEYWSVLPFPSPGEIPIPRIEFSLLHLLHWILYHCAPWEAYTMVIFGTKDEKFL